MASSGGGIPSLNTPMKPTSAQVTPTTSKNTSSKPTSTHGGDIKGYRLTG